MPGIDPEPVAEIEYLDDLLDVDAPTPQEDDVLIYDADNGEWVNIPKSELLDGGNF